MSVFVAVLTPRRGLAAEVPRASTRALAVAGAGPAELYATDGFACAVARTRADHGLLVRDGRVVAGDVRLDGIRAAGAPKAPHDDLAHAAAAFAALGEGMPATLRGDFSLVGWDPGAGTLVAARDGLGVRPLFFARTPGGLVVSNLIAAVRAHPEVPAALDPRSVASFLEFGYTRDPTATTFGAIRRLAPGTLLRASTSRLDPEIAVHWTFPDPDPLNLRRSNEYVERYRALLELAVADRLRGESTLLFLSGGLDSTTIAAAARRVDPDGRIVAVTTRAEGGETLREGELAAATAARLGIPHDIVATPPRALAGWHGRTPEPLDEPEFASQAALLARYEGVASVACVGEDGDALFAPPGLRAQLRRASPLATLSRIVWHTLRTGQKPHVGFGLARRLMPWRNDARPTPDWFTPFGASHRDTTWRDPAPASRFRPESASRFSTTLWQALHVASDRAYHGAAMEFRWPLLDTRLIEFVHAIPPIPWCQRKQLLRTAYRDELPARVTRRRKTTPGGYTPALVAEWQRRTGARVPDLHPVTREFVDPARLARALASANPDAVMMAWSALEFDGWVRGAA